MPHKYLLATGSNTGHVSENLEKAARLLHDENITVLKTTEAVNTAPILYHFQNKFMNQGILIETDLEPAELLNLCNRIEQKIGRIRRFRYGPREIDIDIIWWSGGRYSDKDLQVPHPANYARHWVRSFLAELLPDQKDITTELRYTEMPEKTVTKITDFARKKRAGEKITMLTVYDYSMARLLARSSIDTVLVGDSLSNVFQGNRNTLPVTVENMIYHTAAVRRAMPDHFITTDMPFLSYQAGEHEAVKNAGRILKESGADAVKLEGGDTMVPVVEKLTAASIPVMGHLGLTPQSVLKTGGYRLQAREKDEAEQLKENALALQHAGIFALVLEMVPARLAADVSELLDIPVIGIGAGNGTDGQVLVINDLLGIDPDFQPRFVRRYADLSEIILKAVEQYNHDTRAGSFPDESESY